MCGREGGLLQCDLPRLEEEPPFSIDIGSSSAPNCSLIGSAAKQEGKIQRHVALIGRLAWFI